MKKGRFLWSAHRITERQKAGKARSIKGKQLKNSRNTVLKQLVELLSSQKDNCIFAIINPKVAYGFGDFFTFGSSEQSSCGAAKNSPQDCFLNAATVLKEIIIIRFISSEVSTSELLFVLTSSPRSCKNNKFVQIDHTHREIVCFAKFFNVMNVVYSFVAANSVRHLIWLQNQINKIPIMLKNIVR